MLISVILVNYGKWELTRKCVDSLDRSRNADIRITLIDNFSGEPVPSWVHSRSDIRFRQMATNTGFAIGNNTGFLLSEEDNAEFTFFWKMRYEQADIPHKSFSSDDGIQVDFVSGCALMIRTGLFRKIGGFREDFFMYYEDADLCRKVIEQGYSVNVLPSETVLHSVGSGSGGEMSKLALYYSDRNRILLSRDVISPSMRCIFLLYKSAVLLVMSVKYPLRKSPELVPCIWRAFIDGIAGRTETCQGGPYR